MKIQQLQPYLNIYLIPLSLKLNIVWSFKNISRLKNRPLLAIIFGGEDQKQLGHQIRWLNDIFKHENIYIVPSHDPGKISFYKKKGIIGETFSLN